MHEWVHMRRDDWSGEQPNAGMLKIVSSGGWSQDNYKDASGENYVCGIRDILGIGYDDPSLYY